MRSTWSGRAGKADGPTLKWRFRLVLRVLPKGGLEVLRRRVLPDQLRELPLRP